MILREGHFETINNYDFAWTDIQKPTRDHINMLGKQYPFHELNLDDCLSKIHIPKIDKYKDHLFIILNFPVNMQEEKPEYDTPKVSQLSIFVGTNYLVTIHQSELKPLVEMFQLCKSNDKERETSMGDSPGFLLHSILDALVSDLFHRLTKIQGNLNDLEEDIFDERTKSAKAKEINLLRREIASLRRIAISLRNRILEITNEIQKFSKEDIISYYNDVEDHVKKIVETLEEAKETIEIYKDVYYMLGTEKANKILSILTIIFTLSIPVTVISSFYGMNIRLPGRIEAPPTFLGPYTSMIFVIILSIIPTLSMYWYFRRAGWMSFD
ncbi:MAG: magnesium transporter CorA family protein [Candidatus Nitrosopolaris sp.]